MSGRPSINCVGNVLQKNTHQPRPSASPKSCSSSQLIGNASVSLLKQSQLLLVDGDMRGQRTVGPGVLLPKLGHLLLCRRCHGNHAGKENTGEENGAGACAVLRNMGRYCIAIKRTGQVLKWEEKPWFDHLMGDSWTAHGLLNEQCLKPEVHNFCCYYSSFLSTPFPFFGLLK